MSVLRSSSIFASLRDSIAPAIPDIINKALLPLEIEFKNSAKPFNPWMNPVPKLIPDITVSALRRVFESSSNDALNTSILPCIEFR